MANSSLGGATRNIAPQFSWTHLILKQHRIHFKNTFTSNYISKDYPSHVEFETSIEFTKNNNLILQMSGQGKSFRKTTFQVPLFKNTKGMC
jgi:hypothetical protein